MDISTFSSFLEVFTGLNFVYVLSQSFIETIKNNFSNTQNKINERLEDIKGRLKLSKDNVYALSKEPISIGYKTNVDKLKTFINTLNDLESKLDSHDVKNKENIGIKIDILELRSICLFAGLFCLFYLIVIPLQNIFPSFINDNILFSINIFSIIFIIISIYLFTLNVDGKITKFFQTHTNIILIFLAIIVISFSINILSCTKNIVEVLFLTNQIKQLCQVLILFVPSLHFILYFILVIKEKNKLCKKPLKELDKFELEFNDANKPIETHVDSIKSLKFQIE